METGALYYLNGKSSIRTHAFVCVKKTFFLLENKKKGKYPFSFRREKLLRASIIIEIKAGGTGQH